MKSTQRYIVILALVVAIWLCGIVTVSVLGSIYVYMQIEFGMSFSEISQYRFSDIYFLWSAKGNKATALAMIAFSIFSWLCVIASGSLNRRHALLKSTTLTFAILTSIAVAHTTLRLSQGFFEVTFAEHDARIRSTYPGMMVNTLFVSRPWWDVSDMTLWPMVVLAILLLLTVLIAAARLRRPKVVLNLTIYFGIVASVLLSLSYVGWWKYESEIPDSYGGMFPNRLYLGGLLLSTHLLVTMLGCLSMHAILTRRQRVLSRGKCLVCGYDLAGITEKCPECGTVISPRTA